MHTELGEFPEKWVISTLEEVAKLSAGGDKPEICYDKKSKEYPYPIYSNGLDQNGLYGYTNKYKINEESVTVSARGTIGFVCLRHGPYVPIVQLVTIVPKKDKINAKYLYLYLKRLHITGTGTTQQQLTVPDFKKTKIIVPPFKIIKQFTDIIKLFYENLWDNEIEIEKLTKLRNTLLPKLMSGDIDVSGINFD